MAEVLRADLGRIRLASLVQLAEGELFTGLLELPGAELTFRDGEPVDARCGALRGIDALRQMFLLARGAAVLTPREVAEARPMGNVLALVMEGCRIADEWDRVGPMVLAPTSTEPLAGLPAEVVRGLDGRRSLARVLGDLGVPAIGALDPVLRLLDAGALREVAPPRPDDVRTPTSPSEPTPPAPPPRTADPRVRAAPDYWARLEDGRRLLRAGDLAGAEAAFRDALEARPGDRIATQNLRRARALREASP